MSLYFIVGLYIAFKFYIAALPSNRINNEAKISATSPYVNRY